MKKMLVLVVIFLLAASVNIWAGGTQEEKTSVQAEEKPVMDKIIYLSAEYHDSPDVLPYWAEEFKRIAGEFTDVLKYGEHNIKPLARQEFIIPLNDYIDNSPGMKKLKDMFPASFDAHSIDGVVYGIPALVGSQRGLWVRTDILEKLGLSMPTTLNELVDTLKAMRDNYPTARGSQMFPYISKTYHHGYISVLSNYFDVSIDPAIKRLGDSKFREGWDTTQFKEYAEFMKMLWDEKLIDPDHALPQKASKTRSKLYSGDGAFLAMWTDRYPSMIAELREEFPNAELDLVPPIVNPKGGVLGLSVVPGYRPFCITKEAENPEFVFRNFIEPLYLSVEGVMLITRGIPGINYTIVNNTFVDNFEESGVHLKTRPAVNADIVMPYLLPPDTQQGVDIETKFNKWFADYSNYAIAEEPSVLVPSFDFIYDDMKDKKNQLFWKYVIGEFGYDEMMSRFEAYKEEIDFQNILNEINSNL